jgi:hypothetical protein
MMAIFMVDPPIVSRLRPRSFVADATILVVYTDVNMGWLRAN